MRLTRRIVLTAPLIAAACSKGDPVTLPFREANDHLVAQVSFQGRSTLALIDNGAPMSSVDQAFATSAGLARDLGGVGLRPLSAQLGDASLGLHPFTEDMSEAAIATDAPLGALLGMELFKAFTPAFSFTHGQLTLHRRPHFSPGPDARIFPTDEGPVPHPQMRLSVEGTEMNAFIDLGCSSALALSAAFAGRIGLNDGRRSSTRQVILSDANGLGMGTSRITSVAEATFAGQSFRDVPVDILPSEAKAFAGLDAVVGVPLLRRFDIALDLPRRMALASNARVATTFERRMTGLQTKPVGANLLVRHVAAQSPGEAAGFKVGDLIRAIDGAAPLMRTLRHAVQGQALAITLANGEVRRLTGARYY